MMQRDLRKTRSDEASQLAIWLRSGEGRWQQALLHVGIRAASLLPFYISTDQL